MFIINSDGSVSNLRYLNRQSQINTIYPIVEKKLTELIYKAPKWDPAYKNGMPVPTAIKMEVNVDQINQQADEIKNPLDKVFKQEDPMSIQLKGKLKDQHKIIQVDLNTMVDSLENLNRKN